MKTLNLLFCILVLTLHEVRSKKCGRNVTSNPPREPSLRLKKNNTITYLTVPNRDLTIYIKIHIDLPNFKKTAEPNLVNALYLQSLRQRVRELLKKTEQYFIRNNLFAPIKFKILAINFIASMARFENVQKDINQLITDYCAWQLRKKKFAFQKPEKIWYFSIMLTTLKLAYYNSHGIFERSRGNAWLDGLCNIKSNCAVMQFLENTEEQVVVMAHELAHSFGIDHDEQTCDEFGIMAPRLEKGPLPTVWTNCSRDYLEKFLASEKLSWCLGDLFGNSTFIPRSKREINQTNNLQILQLNNSNNNPSSQSD